MKPYNVWLYIVAKMFILAGALNWGAMAINPEYNIFSGEQTTFKRIIYGIIGLSAIHVSLQPKTFLPFLGDCAFPVFNYIHDTTSTKFYLNGELKNTSSQGSGAIASLPTLSIGSYVNGGGTPGTYFHSGNIAQVSIYNRALSTSEILQNYNATKKRFGL